MRKIHLSSVSLVTGRVCVCVRVCELLPIVLFLLQPGRRLGWYQMVFWMSVFCRQHVLSLVKVLLLYPPVILNNSFFPTTFCFLPHLVLSVLCFSTIHFFPPQPFHQIYSVTKACCFSFPMFLSWIISFYFIVKSEKESEVTQSWLHDPMACSPPGFSVHGVFQEEYWSKVPFPLVSLKLPQHSCNWNFAFTIFFDKSNNMSSN